MPTNDISDMPANFEISERAYMLFFKKSATLPVTDNKVRYWVDKGLFIACHAPLRILLLKWWCVISVFPHQVDPVDGARDIKPPAKTPSSPPITDCDNNNIKASLKTPSPARNGTKHKKIEKKPFHERQSFRGVPFNSLFIKAIFFLFQYFNLEKMSGGPLKSVQKVR